MKELMIMVIFIVKNYFVKLGQTGAVSRYIGISVVNIYVKLTKKSK